MRDEPTGATAPLPEWHSAAPPGYVGEAHFRRVRRIAILSTIVLFGSVLWRIEGPRFVQTGRWQSARNWFYHPRRTKVASNFGSGAAIAMYSAPAVQPAAWIAAYVKCCTNPTPPPDRIAYEEDPSAAANLAAEDGYSSACFIRYDTRYMGDNTACDDHEYLAMIPGQVWHEPVALAAPPEWRILAGSRQVFDSRRMQPDNYVFLHELVSPAGHRRLVWLGVGRRGRLKMEPFPLAPGTRTYRVASHAYLSGSVMRTPFSQGWPWQTFTLDVNIQRPPSEDVITWTKGRTWDAGPVKLAPGDHLRFYTGQLDPQDSSHFTVDFEFPHGHRSTIDFFLRDDDTLAMSPRAGTAKTSPAGSSQLDWLLQR